jgi:hypothetical protein
VRPKAGTLLERVHRIQSHVLEVWCGMIVGFDHDDRAIFDAIPKFIDDARIGNALIGLLHAIPTTPLHVRLKESGKLNDEEASNRYGTNVVPLLMSREELRDGFVDDLFRAHRRAVHRRWFQICTPAARLLGAAAAWLWRSEAPGTTSNSSLLHRAFSSASRS